LERFGSIVAFNIACFPRIVISTHSLQGKTRLAASGYLNSAPLIWSFTRGSQRNAVTYIDAVPARCGELLAAAEADFALVPIIEYQRLPNVKLVPRVCVGSREKVRSVVLVSRFNNLKKIRSVALDESSRTSATLIKVIFKEFLGIEPMWSTSTPNVGQMLRDCDAALVIGDPAMTFERRGLNVWDMANLWRDFTGRGFVFAMWMAKGTETLRVDFVAAREEGVNAIDQIIKTYEPELRLPAEDLREYLTNNVTFELDDDLEGGMQLYFELATRHGLIEQAKPVEFLGGGSS
jgi:chorismate dehydratase